VRSSAARLPRDQVRIREPSVSDIKWRCPEASAPPEIAALLLPVCVAQFKRPSCEVQDLLKPAEPGGCAARLLRFCYRHGRELEAEHRALPRPR
jgi:hypothetical protein